MVPPWVTVSRFLAGNRETELKLTTFSSLQLFPCFPVFALLLTPQRYSTVKYCLLVLLDNDNDNNNNYNKYNNLYLLLLILLRSNPGRQHSKVLYRWEPLIRGNTGKENKKK